MAAKATAEATLVVAHANSPLGANKVSYQHSLTYQRQTQPPININADQHEQQAITNQTLAASVEQQRKQRQRQKRFVTLSSPIVDRNIFKNDNNSNNLPTTDTLLNCLLIFALISSIVNVSLISFVVRTIQVDQGHSNVSIKLSAVFGGLC